MAMALGRTQSLHPARLPWHTSGWKLGRCLGRGTFAGVYAATRASTNEKGAVKVVTKDDEDNREEIIDAEVEIVRLVTKRLAHSDGVVKLKDVFEDDINVYIVTDLCYGGTLADKLQKGPLGEADAMIVTRKILETLHDLHASNFIHCDIKPENILFSDAEDLSTCKIADFGLTLYEKSASDQPLMGSPLYVAPEVLTKQRYSPAVDVWAVGVMTYHMLCGRVPFSSDEKTIQNALRFYDEIWEDVTPHAKDFTSKCLIKCGLERISCAALQRHPWLCRPGVVRSPTTKHQVSPSNRMRALRVDPRRSGHDSETGDELCSPSCSNGGDLSETSSCLNSPMAGCLFSQAVESIPFGMVMRGLRAQRSHAFSNAEDSDDDDWDDDFVRLTPGQRQDSDRIERGKRLLMRSLHQRRHSAYRLGG